MSVGTEQVNRQTVYLKSLNSRIKIRFTGGKPNYSSLYLNFSLIYSLNINRSSMFLKKFNIEVKGAGAQLKNTNPLL